MKKLLIVLTAVLAVGLYSVSGAYAKEHHKSGNTNVGSGNGNFSFNIQGNTGNANASVGSPSTVNNNNMFFGF